MMQVVNNMLTNIERVNCFFSIISIIKSFPTCVIRYAITNLGRNVNVAINIEVEDTITAAMPEYSNSRDCRKICRKLTSNILNTKLYGIMKSWMINELDMITFNTEVMRAPV